MKRLVLAGLAAGIAMACGAVACADPGEGDYRPIKGVVVDKNWDFLMDTGARQVFIQHAPSQSGENPTAFLRYEERENQGDDGEPMYSMRTAFEFDCDDGLFRSLSSEFFAGNNLTKRYDTMVNSPKAWAEPAPASIALAAFDRVCAKRG